MRKAHTSSSSRGNIQYIELSVSYLRKKRNRLSLLVVRSMTVAHTPIRSLSIPLVDRSQSKLPCFHINRSLFHMSQLPLHLAQKLDILVSALKYIPNFIGETSISPMEHIQEISNFCNKHGIIGNNFVVRLLASSLKGKALEWYRGLPHNSITDWDGLGVVVCIHF